MKKFLVYSGYGTSEHCLKELVAFLEQKCCPYELVTAREIRSNWLDNNPRAILCFGGGFDLGFLSSLDQEGCSNIKKFVKLGGTYLGICAGAYFACKQIEFDLDGPLEVKGQRLGFFDGTAKGPVNRKFAYNCEDHSMAARLRSSNGEQVYGYLNGGPYFEPSSSSFHTLLTYCDQKNGQDMLKCDGKVAVLETRFGMGKCVLSGVHFEFGAESLDLGNQNLNRARWTANDVPIIFLSFKTLIALERLHLTHQAPKAPSSLKSVLCNKV
ncbi:biotin-- ligase-like [Brachionus plicatilis]|uniref:Biotin--ligase-like n=1 Tax=Brachionus plicatilis TaxID=10195 RepID=A0A3M7QKX6_BRAPC|nr:biotin-- ligase-like [Brachionus plicatilis]